MNTGDNLLDRVLASLGAQALETGMAHGILVLQIAPESLVPMVGRLKQELGFDLFLDVTATDWPQRRPRFDVVYHFYSTRDFVRKPEDSPNPSHGHHEFGNAETYFLVGDALGKGMLKLVATQPK